MTPVDRLTLSAPGMETAPPDARPHRHPGHPGARHPDGADAAGFRRLGRARDRRRLQRHRRLHRRDLRRRLPVGGAGRRSGEAPRRHPRQPSRSGDRRRRHRLRGDGFDPRRAARRGADRRGLWADDAGLLAHPHPPDAAPPPRAHLLDQADRRAAGRRAGGAGGAGADAGARLARRRLGGGGGERRAGGCLRAFASQPRRRRRSLGRGRARHVFLAPAGSGPARAAQAGAVLAGLFRHAALHQRLHRHLPHHRSRHGSGDAPA